MNRQMPWDDAARFKAWVQTVNDTLDRLVRGSQNAGRVSFSNQIQIGDILIESSGDVVTFSNVADGKTATITLT